MTEKILIVDDFLASGRTIDALGRIVTNSGAALVGIAKVVLGAKVAKRGYLNT